MTPTEILTPKEMAKADALTIAAGTPGMELMERAGKAVADRAAAMLQPGSRVIVLCGPGNNGGDGFVAARLLRDDGVDVAVALLGSPGRLVGDAAEAAARWSGACAPLNRAWVASSLVEPVMIIDAVFGAGLSRDVGGDLAACFELIDESGHPVLAVDLASGVDGATGAIRGRALRAVETVSFFRAKPGHLLFPGRGLGGRLTIADIGIQPGVLEQIACATFANGPGLWLHDFPFPQIEGHKYDRGHAVVVSGPAECTGAARLAARGALRAGAGLVTLVSQRAAFPVNAAQLTAIMIRPYHDGDGLARILQDKRLNAVLIGPGAGTSNRTRDKATAVLGSGARVILDADALTVFAGRLDELSGLIKLQPARPVILTPHEGEFAKLFDGAAGSSKLERARSAARASGAIVVLKGPDTIIAAPDGRAAINANAPAWLATAGSGDVLAGIIVGMLAQGMAAWEAAAASVWMHGDGATRFGPGLIAEDLPELLPEVLRGLDAGRSPEDLKRANSGVT